MALKWGIRIWGPNDTGWADAESNPDTSNPWIEEIANIQITEGGFGPLRNGSPAIVRAEVKADALSLTNLYADLSAFLAFSFTGPCGIDTPADFANQLSNDDWERVMFVGQWGTYKGTLPSPEFVNVDWVSYASHFLNAVPRVAADGTASVSSLLNDIGVALSPSPSGSNRFPDRISGYQLDAPASDDQPVGSYMAPATAGYGMWIGPLDYSMVYDGDNLDDGTSNFNPYWRPSYSDSSWRDGGASTAHVEAIEIYYPYQLEILDYGRAYGDHPNRVRVNGTTGNTGTYSQGGALPLVTSTVSTYIDNDTECDTAAEILINQCGMPHPKIFNLTVHIEDYYRDMVAAGSSADDAEAVCWKLGAARIGDHINLRTEAVGDGIRPVGSVTSDDLMTEICAPSYAKVDGDTPTRRNVHAITSYTKRFDPVAGWVCSFSLRPGLAWSTS